MPVFPRERASDSSTVSKYMILTFRHFATEFRDILVSAFICRFLLRIAGSKADPIIKSTLRKRSLVLQSRRQMLSPMGIIYRQGGEMPLREFYDTQNMISC